MESAGADALPVVVEERVQQHATMLQRLGTAMDRVLQTMDRLEREAGFPASPPAPLQQVPLSTPPSGIRLVLPRVFDGTASGCQGFLLQLELCLVTVHPAPSGHESVSALVSCLSGKALEWANAVGCEGALDHYAEFAFGQCSPTRLRDERQVNVCSI